MLKNQIALSQLALPGTTGLEGQPQSITIKTLPRSVFYAYTFLISTIVQLDPIGRHPKCLHFAAAGLERLIEMLDFGWDFRSSEVVEGMPEPAQIGEVHS